MNRRTLLTSAALAPVAIALSPLAAFAAMLSPWEWTSKNGVTGHMKKDTNPTDKEFEKYPRCTYCGMVREQWSQTRHLIQYDDESCEGTCSIHCLSLSLGLNMDRVPKRIWVGDAGSDAEIKPLIDASKAHYALDPTKPGTMSATRKWAYADPEKAAASGAARVVGFEEALEVAYADMAKSTLMIRKRRAEKRAHMAKKMEDMKTKGN
ncbi:nitrous oxide reductase accessory protein NosL [Cohaesibacter haloalkalitolerans]|uniref:nitrous oxide reductase accessory protein NosL n=1 Tax=Cohaesibacter haloalkalitolerans TaxID=1162980 RepID=UPI000E6599B1|nr:nitrous oxide reductase accessory protein NosL [Cohaesibacter haloalkalitolerans]